MYTPDELKPWVKRTKQVAEHAASEAVDVVFNNHYKGKAVVNAVQFRKLLEGRRADAPPPLPGRVRRHARPLAAAYQDELKGYARASGAGREAA